MRVQFANGRVYQVTSMDEAISKSLKDGYDPFRPVVLPDEPQEKKIKNADSVKS